MIYKVKDNGWGEGETFVNITNDKIHRGDYYLYINRKGEPRSIELCDSDDLAVYVNRTPKEYKKIIKASQVIHKGMAIYNNNVIIDGKLGTNS